MRKVWTRLLARRSLESYCHRVLNPPDALMDWMGDATMRTLETAVKETLDWIDQNVFADVDDFAAKLRVLKGVVDPIASQAIQDEANAWGLYSDYSDTFDE